MPSLNENIKHLRDRGYSTSEMEADLSFAKEAAEWCRIEDVLKWTMNVESSFSFLYPLIYKRRSEDPSPNVHFNKDYEALFDLKGQVIAEILATLKAKQCKCG